MNSLSLGFQDVSRVGSLEEILARTQQAGAAAVEQLQQVAGSTQLANTNTNRTGAPAGGNPLANVNPFAQEIGVAGGEKIEGKSLSESIEFQLRNNEKTLLGNGVELGAALLGGVANVVGGGLSFLGLESASGVGTKLFGKSKDVNTLIDQLDTVKGIEREDRKQKFDKEFAIEGMRRESKRAREELRNKAAIAFFKTTEDAKTVKLETALEDRRIAAERKFTSKESALDRQGRLNIAGLRVESDEAKEKRAVQTAKDTKDSDRIAKAEDAAAAAKKKRGDDLRAFLPTTLGEIQNDTELQNLPASEFVLGGSGTDPGYLGMVFGQGNFVPSQTDGPNGTKIDGPPQARDGFLIPMKERLFEQGLKAITSGDVPDLETFATQVNDGLGMLATKLRESAGRQVRRDADSNIVNPDIAAAGGIAQSRLAAANQLVSANLPGILVGIEKAHDRSKLLTSVATFVQEFDPENVAASNLVDALATPVKSLGEADQLGRRPLQKLLEDPRLQSALQLAPLLQQFRGGDRSSSIVEALVRGKLVRVNPGISSARSGFSSGTTTETDLGIKLNNNLIAELLKGSK